MDNLTEIIKQSSFEVQDGLFAYAQVSTLPTGQGHFMVAVDKDEITVVTREENLKELEIIEKNKEWYTLIALNVSIPFYSIGFLATVTAAIAQAEMDVLVISTYSKDYIMVKKENLDKALGALLQLGLSRKEPI